MFSQNTINTTGSFHEAFFHMFCLFFILNELHCLRHYFIEHHPPTADVLVLFCGLFRFYHKLAGAKKSQDDDKSFNSYEFHLYEIHCAVAHDVQKAERMKLAVEGYIHAALFLGIFYIIPSDYADNNSIEVPGTVTTTELQFKKNENAKWPVIPKKTV